MWHRPPQPSRNIRLHVRYSWERKVWIDTCWNHGSPVAGTGRVPGFQVLDFHLAISAHWRIFCSNKNHRKWTMDFVALDTTVWQDLTDIYLQVNASTWRPQQSSSSQHYWRLHIGYLYWITYSPIRSRALRSSSSWSVWPLRRKLANGLKDAMMMK